MTAKWLNSDYLPNSSSPYPAATTLESFPYCKCSLQVHPDNGHGNLELIAVQTAAVNAAPEVVAIGHIKTRLKLHEDYSHILATEAKTVPPTTPIKFLVNLFGMATYTEINDVAGKTALTESVTAHM